MSNAKRRIPMLTDKEEARLQEQIARDPDCPELTDEQLAKARPASEVLPPALYAALTRPRLGQRSLNQQKLSCGEPEGT